MQTYTEAKLSPLLSFHSGHLLRDSKGISITIPSLPIMKMTNRLCTQCKMSA